MARANVCVVGCGYWGKNLVRTFSSVGCLGGICDSDGESRKLGSQLCPSAKIYNTYDDVLNDPQITAVAIATPAETHYDLAIAALSAGKHLFVEKPLALDWQDGVEMTALALKKRRVLMVGHILQYHPAIARLKDVISQGMLGRIEYIYSNRLSMGKIRREENALWSFAPHDISVILSLVGQMPCQVISTGGAYLQPNIADVTMSNLLFARGTRAHIFVSWLHPYKEQRLVVIGTKKMAVFEDTPAGRKLMLFNKEIELKNGMLEAIKPDATMLEFDSTEPLLLECREFVACIQDGTQPRTSGEEGVQVLKVLQACQLSLQLNGEAVRVAQPQKVMAM